MAQQKELESKKNPVRMTKGFSLMMKLDTRRKCAICKSYIVKGESALRHCALVGKRIGKPSYVHAKVQCLVLLETNLMAEFLAKKWTEQFMCKLTSAVAKKKDKMKHEEV